MSTTTEIHPNAVLSSLVAKGNRSHRRRNLERVYEVCRKHHDSGSRDFSRATIGRLCEVENIFKDRRVLYNAQSSDYVAIIESWAVYAGPTAPKSPKTLASHDYLTRIEDPALRFIMQSIISERDKLQAQLNTLKSHAYTTVDRRPLGANITSNAMTGPVLVLEKHAQLTPSERDALRKAISSEFLSDEGWREGSHGEIFNHADRTLFDVGFTTAIRKVLADSK